ncbi:MAG: cytochrome P450 [Leptolyngbyaceae bacterium]|nr:cytochrome P450 [Leptolyngbyaceae bacterium]
MMGTRLLPRTNSLSEFKFIVTLIVRRYGPLFKIGGNSSPPLIDAGEPEVVREVFALNSSQAITGKGNTTLGLLVGDQSILLLDGEPHQRQRKLLMPPFHGDRLRRYAQLICDITRQVSADWQRGQSFVARPPLQDLALSLIMPVVFGSSHGPRLHQIQTTMGTMLDFFAYPIAASVLFFPGLRKDWGPWSPWGRFVRLRERVRTLLHAKFRLKSKAIAVPRVGKRLRKF